MERRHAHQKLILTIYGTTSTGERLGCSAGILSGTPENQTHGLKGELVVAHRIVHPEIECQTADHGCRDAFQREKTISSQNCTVGKWTYHPDQLTHNEM